jgi:hypothetical protein
MRRTSRPAAPEDFGLHHQRKVTDLVQEKGSFVGGFKEADLAGRRAGEGPGSYPKSSLSIRFSGMAAQLTP